MLGKVGGKYTNKAISEDPEMALKKYPIIAVRRLNLLQNAVVIFS